MPRKQRKLRRVFCRQPGGTDEYKYGSSTLPMSQLAQNVQAMRLILPFCFAVVLAIPQPEPLPPNEEEVDIRIEPFQNLVAASSIGTVYPEQSYAHLVVTLSTADLLAQRQAFACMSQKWRHLLDLGKLSPTTKLRYQMMASFANGTLTTNIGILEDILKSLGVPIPPLWPEAHAGKHPTRVKRQFVIGAVIGAVAGASATYAATEAFSEDDVDSIVDQEEGVIAQEVSRNTLSTVANREDIKKLNATTAVLVKQLGRLSLNMTATQLDLLLLVSGLTISEASTKFTYTVLALDRARRGTFDIHLATHDGLEIALTALRQNAARHGRTLAIATPNDLSMLPVTLVYRPKTRNLHVVVHIPLKTERLTLYSLYAPAYMVDNRTRVYAQVDTDDYFLAVNTDRTLHQEYSGATLRTCTKISSDYFCPRTVLRKAHNKGCLSSLFANDQAGVRQLCNFRLHLGQPDAIRFNESTWLITEVEESEIAVSCEERTIKQERFTGTRAVRLQPGCQASTKNLVLSRPAFEGTVNIGAALSTLPMFPALVLPKNSDSQWLETAHDLLRETGSSVDPSTVTRLVRFKEEIKRLEALKHQHHAGTWQSIILHAVAPAIGTALTIILFCYLARWLYDFWYSRRFNKAMGRSPRARASYRRARPEATVSSDPNWTEEDQMGLARLEFKRKEARRARRANRSNNLLTDEETVTDQV